MTVLAMIDLLRDWQVLLLAASTVLTLGLAVLLWLRLRRLRLAPPAVAPVVDLLAAPREAMVLTPALMRQAFRNGLSEYRQAVAGSSNPYLVPWVLAVGTRGGGTSALCAAGGSARPPAAVPDPATGKPLGCAWWFYDRAVVIDVAGEAFADLRGDRLSDGAWIALLEELTRARDGLPLDGILLTLPVPDLAGPEALPAATLAAKAAEIHTRLWQVQKVTGLTLPVWLVLTMGDAIPGFQHLLAALPPEAQDSAFGWSSPYPLEASFQPTWIGEAMDSMQDAAAAAGLELGAAGAGGDRGCRHAPAGRVGPSAWPAGDVPRRAVPPDRLPGIAVLPWAMAERRGGAGSGGRAATAAWLRPGCCSRRSSPSATCRGRCRAGRCCRVAAGRSGAAPWRRRRRCSPWCCGPASARWGGCTPASPRRCGRSRARWRRRRRPPPAPRRPRAPVRWRRSAASPGSAPAGRTRSGRSPRWTPPQIGCAPRWPLATGGW
ncbi:type VI secretion system protein [Siccirubricoccus deserti]